MGKIVGRKVDSNSVASPGARPNTIGVPTRELSSLMDRLDERGSGGEAAAKRTHSRWPFRQTSVRFVLDHPGGTKAEFQVACRNLSRGGSAVLHSAYVHVGTGCQLFMPRLDSKPVGVPGKIVRCQHVQGLVHELGVRFEEPLNLAEYVNLDPLMGWNSFERVDPAKLSGTLLCVIASELDQRIIGHYLSDSQMKPRFAKDKSQALTLAAEGCDVLMLDLTVPDAPDIAVALRQAGLTCPIIAVSADAGSKSRQQMRDLGVEGFLLKPLSSDRMLGSLAECLLTGESGQVAAPNVSPAILAGCVEQLKTCAAEMREAFTADDPMRCYALCQHVRTAAIPIGLKQLARLADQAATSLAQTMSLTESGQKVQDVLRACERIRSPGGR